MKAYEKIEKTIYQPVKAGGKGKFSKIVTIGSIAAGAYYAYKKYVKEEKYPEFEADLNNSREEYEATEEEKFAQKIVNAAKKAGKDVEEKFDKIKKNL